MQLRICDVFSTQRAHFGAHVSFKSSSGVSEKNDTTQEVNTRVVHARPNLNAKTTQLNLCREFMTLSRGQTSQLKLDR